MKSAGDNESIEHSPTFGGTPILRGPLGFNRPQGALLFSSELAQVNRFLGSPWRPKHPDHPGLHPGRQGARARDLATIPLRRDHAGTKEAPELRPRTDLSPLTRRPVAEDRCWRPLARPRQSAVRIREPGAHWYGKFNQ